MLCVRRFLLLTHYLPRHVAAKTLLSLDVIGDNVTTCTSNWGLEDFSCLPLLVPLASSTVSLCEFYFGRHIGTTDPPCLEVLKQNLGTVEVYRRKCNAIMIHFVFQSLVMSDRACIRLSLVGNMIGVFTRHMRFEHASVARVAVLSARDARVVPCE